MTTNTPQVFFAYRCADFDDLCFRHAVYVAMQGIAIETVAVAEPPVCPHCEEDAIVLNLRKKAWSNLGRKKQ